MSSSCLNNSNPTSGQNVEIEISAQVKESSNTNDDVEMTCAHCQYVSRSSSDMTQHRWEVHPLLTRRKQHLMKSSNTKKKDLNEKKSPKVDDVTVNKRPAESDVINTNIFEKLALEGCYPTKRICSMENTREESASEINRQVLQESKLAKDLSRKDENISVVNNIKEKPVYYGGADNFRLTPLATDENGNKSCFPSSAKIAETSKPHHIISTNKPIFVTGKPDDQVISEEASFGNTSGSSDILRHTYKHPVTDGALWINNSANVAATPLWSAFDSYNTINLLQQQAQLFSGHSYNKPTSELFVSNPFLSNFLQNSVYLSQISPNMTYLIQEPQALPLTTNKPRHNNVIDLSDMTSKLLVNDTTDEPSAACETVKRKQGLQEAQIMKNCKDINSVPAEKHPTSIIGSSQKNLVISNAIQEKQKSMKEKSTLAGKGLDFKKSPEQRQPMQVQKMDDNRVKTLERALQSTDCCDPNERSSILPFRCPDGKWRMVRTKRIGGAWLVQMPGVDSSSVYLPKTSNNTNTLNDWLKSKLNAYKGSTSNQRNEERRSLPANNKTTGYFRNSNGKKTLLNNMVHNDAIKNLLLQKTVAA